MKKIRRYDLDWLRVLVFMLLIFYHVGMFFVPWGWHIKNNVLYDWLAYPMLFVNQWRLAILFVISGMGTCFALSYRTTKLYVKERMIRLGIPLLFGMIIIVPPQVYIERLVQGRFKGAYLSFYTDAAFTQGVYPDGNISWHHLWFLPYLLIFSLILSPVFIYLRSNPDLKFLSWCKRILDKRLGLYIFIVPLFLAEAFLEPFFNVTHALIGDWFALANYMILFFYGYLFIKLQDSFWTAIERIKFIALVVGVLFFSLFLIIIRMEDGVLVHFTEAIIKVINFWSWILVLFGYGAQYLNKNSKWLSYCNKAVYPFYILHQTVTIILAYFMISWKVGLAIKFLLLSLGTFFFSWALYEFVVRRIKLLRPLFGLKPISKT